MSAELAGLEAQAVFDEFTEAECAGPASEATKERAKAGTADVFFGNRVCPFAHRVFWTLAERDAVDKYGRFRVGWSTSPLLPFFALLPFNSASRPIQLEPHQNTPMLT